MNNEGSGSRRFGDVLNFSYIISFVSFNISNARKPGICVRGDNRFHRS